GAQKLFQVIGEAIRSFFIDASIGAVHISSILWRNSRGRPLNAPAALIYQCQPIVASSLHLDLVGVGCRRFSKCMSTIRKQRKQDSTATRSLPSLSSVFHLCRGS